MSRLERRVDKIPYEIAEAIKFYESELPPEVLRECQEAAGTEVYVDLLMQKYREMFKKNA